MVDHKKLHALIALLDDPDKEVADIVEDQILQSGDEFADPLEEVWLSGQYGDELNQRIAEVLKKIQKKQLKKDLSDWLSAEYPDPMQGWVLASRIQYPNFDMSLVKAHLSRLKIDAWVKLSGIQNPIDKIKTLNHVFFEVYGFQGNSENYHSPDNSIITRVLETKKGNPISLSILYMFVAQELGMPVFGVNLPQHFVLGYCKLHNESQFVHDLKRDDLKLDHIERVMFYVNPFSKGQVFTEESVDAFLKVIGVEPKPSFYNPCESLEIFKRILRNMHFAYSEQQNLEKQKEVEEIMRFIGQARDEE